MRTIPQSEAGGIPERVRLDIKELMRISPLKNAGAGARRDAGKSGSFSGSANQTPGRLLGISEAALRKSFITIAAGLALLVTHDLFPGRLHAQSPAAVFPAQSDQGANQKFDQLIAALTKGDSLEKHRAAIALGHLGDKRAVDPLIKALDDPDEFVRGFAAKALGYIADPRAAAPLIKALDDREDIVKRSAAMALGNLGDLSAVDPLIKALASNSFILQRAAAISLGKLGDPKAIDPLIKLLESDERFLQDGAESGLAGIGRPALPKLLNLLDDWTMGPRVAGILDDLKWQPTSDEEKIRYRVASRNRQSLLDDWQITKKILLDDARSDSNSRARNAVFALIGIGLDEVVQDLAGILGEKGNLELASAFLNCGNGPLSEAARDWISSHKVNLPGGNDNPVVEWGKMQPS